MSRRSLRDLIFLFAIVLLFPSRVRATPPTPVYGDAVVDGVYPEWDLSRDLFAYMYEAGKETHPLESRAYLRYDCRTSAVYVLVLTEPGVIGYDRSADPSATSWVAIDAQHSKHVNEDAGKDGVPPDFAFVEQAFDGNPDRNHGFEASFVLAPGSYNVIIHTAFWNASAGGTSATAGSPGTGPALVIYCAPTGACCAPSGDCQISIQAQCAGNSVGGGACSPNPCLQPPIGVCCDPLGICTMMAEPACNGSWTVGGTCTPNQCPPIPIKEGTWGQIKNIYR